MAKKVFGRVFIAIDGNRLDSMTGTGKLTMGGEERTAVVTDTGSVYYTAKPVHAEVECDIAVSGTTDLKALNNTTDATITFELDTGQMFVVTNAALAAPIDLQSGDGKASLRFIGTAAEPTGVI